jgi:peptide/nickel transport system permease protein
MAAPPPSARASSPWSSLESSQTAGIVAVFGALVGLFLIYSAFGLNSTLSEIASAEELSPVWHDQVWTGLALMSALISVSVFAYLYSGHEKGEPPYHLVVAAGLVTSVALVAFLMLESIQMQFSTFSSNGDALWPVRKPLWFLPLSMLGGSLSMAVLVVAGGGDKRDSVIGTVLSCIPLLLLSVPFLLGMNESDLVRWLPTICAVSGLVLAISGVKVFHYWRKTNVEVLERLSLRVFIDTLGFVGILGWATVDSGETLSSSEDMVWFLPLIVSMLLSLALVAAASNAPRAKRNLLPKLMGISGALLSMVLIAVFSLSFVDVVEFERSLWLYPLSMAGVTLVMSGTSVLGSGTKVDKVVGIAAALVPVLATCAVALIAYSTPTEAQAMLSGWMAMMMYIAFACAVFISGLKVETFKKTQWPVLREKARLSYKRTSLVMRQVVRNPMGLIGIIILIVFMVIAAVGPYIAPYDVDMSRPGEFSRLLPQSADHWMGTDTFGHDIFSQLLFGARTSIIVGIVAALISSVLGAAVGLYSGYAGGWKDEVIMRLNDIVLSIPWLVLMIIIAAFMGSIDLLGIILVIGLTGWSGTARLVRAQVLSLRERQYVERAKAIGSGDGHIIRAHILPNSFPLVFANTILTVAISILSEATLSFLGLRPHGVVTWGTMLSYAQTSSAFTIGLHWWIIAPGICIVLVVLGFTLLGYALDDIMNPKLRKR